jgi:hypothetical protein
MWLLFLFLAPFVFCANIDDVSIQISTFARAGDLVRQPPPPQAQLDHPGLRVHRQRVKRDPMWPYLLIIGGGFLVGIAVLIILIKFAFLSSLFQSDYIFVLALSCLVIESELAY